MTHVVTGTCIMCKHTDCVAVCPTEAFHEGPNFLVINPVDCIDCGLCVGECPVRAIVEAPDLAPEQAHYLELNATLARDWPVIVEKKASLPEAERWGAVTDKLPLLER